MNDNTISGDLMNISQLASHLGMSQASVYHLVAGGKIPGVKVGKQWRFSRKTINEWIQSAAKPSVSVLVVEDDETVRNLIVDVMQRAGHHCIGTESAEKAVTLLEDIEFNIVFLDLILADNDGLQVVRAASGMQKTPHIVVVTGHPDSEMISIIHEILPYATILSKPVNLSTMLDLAAKSAQSP